MQIKTLFIFLIYLFPLDLYGKSFRSIQDGCWDSPNTWNLNQVPLFADTVIVGHTVKFDRSIALHDNAFLQVDSIGYLLGEVDISLTCGTTLINYGRILCAIFDLNGDGANYGTINVLTTYHVSSCYSSYIHGNVHIGSVTDSTLQMFKCPVVFNQILVFPNPVSDHVFIKFLLKTGSYIIIDMFNINGQKISSEVIEGLFPDFNEVNYELPASIPNGIYFLRIFIEGVQLNKQIIVFRNN